jgi:YVTN family beta-propeller protein
MVADIVPLPWRRALAVWRQLVAGLFGPSGMVCLIALLSAGMAQAAGTGGGVATLAFITNQGSDTLSVLDVAARRVVKEIPVGKAPAGVAVSAAAGRAFVTNPGDHSLSVIDLASLAEVARIPAGQGAVGVAVAPDGTRVYVADWYGGALRVIDARSLALVASLVVGTAPAGVAVSADGARVYVAARDDDAVVEVDARRLAVLRRLGVGSHPFAIGLSPDGRQLLALNVLSDDVSVVDLASGREQRRQPVGLAPYGVAFQAGVSGSAALAWVTNQHGQSLSALPLGEAAVQPAAAQRRIATADYPEGIAWVAPDGVSPVAAGAGDPPPLAGILLVVSWMEDAVQLIDPASGRELARIDVGRNPRGFGEMLWRRAPRGASFPSDPDKR